MPRDGYYGWVPILTLIVAVLTLICVLFNVNVS
jgi:hypothetical protein